MPVDAPVQNLALALLSVVFATLPTVAGVFPLWLAVTLHEGATLLVVLNSLRLLQDPQSGSMAQALSSSMDAMKSMLGSGNGSGRDDKHAHGDEHSHGHDGNHVHSHVPNLVQTWR